MKRAFGPVNIRARLGPKVRLVTAQGDALGFLIYEVPSPVRAPHSVGIGTGSGITVFG